MNRSFPTKRLDRGFTLVELLVVIAIIGILVALLLPAIQAAREAARRAQCQSNIKNVALAVLNYESANKRLPEGMTFDPNLGGNNPVQTMREYGPNWIIKILPYLENQAVYDLFDKSAGSGSSEWVAINLPGADNRNVTARGTTISVLLCPSDGNNQIKYQGKAAFHGPNWARGNYAASAGRAFIYSSPTDSNSIHMGGPDSLAWSGKDIKKPSNLMCMRGVMGPNAAVTLQQITDGTSNTIMLGEIRSGLTELDARGVWAMGHAGASLIAMYGGGGDANGPNYCDANADDVYSDTANTGGVCAGSHPECMGVSGGGGFDQATARSQHPGGVHIARCDGSVAFIIDDIETTGCYGSCCSVWDQMILSADAGIGGGFNGVRRGGCLQ